MSILIDGKAQAAALKKELAEEISSLKETGGSPPGLAVILVGEDPASQVYVRSKQRQSDELGMASFSFKLPVSCTEEDLLQKVHDLNNDPKVHGILVQLPLPPHIAEERILEAINPLKDVDGFHPVNMGKLVRNNTDVLAPCTPLGILHLIRSVHDDLSGKHAVIVGRSNIVGKPIAHLLLGQNCTLSVIHSRTKNQAHIAQQADILVVAVGIPKLVTAEWVKPGATVIDVGINRVDGKLVGDVDFDSVAPVAGAITPVPGGVGPMTIAYLLSNTLKAQKLQEETSA